MRRHPDSSLLVHYESLQRNTDGELQKICAWLGLPYESEMVAFQNAAPHFLGGNAGPIIAVGDAHGIDLRDHYHPKADFRPLDRNHYAAMGPQSFHDERWKHELNTGQLRLFNLLAGRLNRKYGYFVDVNTSG